MKSFVRVLVVDYLCRPWQYDNILRSIRWFLASRGRAWVVAGFQTGRKVSGFFEKSTLKKAGLEIERIWERGCEGNERE